MKRASENALLYALRELSRRAGVTFDFFSRWGIELRNDGLVVRPNPDGPEEIHFPLDREMDEPSRGMVRKAWVMKAPAEFQEQIPDFIVPFCRHDSINGEALFVREAAKGFRCTEDLLTSLLFTLCRREEIDSRVSDVHGRFPFSVSLSARHGYATRPIVDEYGVAFQQVLRIMMPCWEPAKRSVRLKLGHDMDELGVPFSLQSTLGHTLFRRAPVLSARDFLSLFTDLEAGYLHAVRRICKLSAQHGLRSSLYWEATAAGPFDTGYDPTHPKILQVIKWAKSQGIEQGVHPGYNTFRSRAGLQEEVQRVQAALGKEKIGGRQHYLRWCPETWLDWESCGLAYDSSVGFVDQAGFRCGTCVPFLPWLWKLDRSADLLEIPLIAMDGTLVEHMKLNPQQSLQTVEDLFKKCSLMGGVFTLVWHNTGLFAPYGNHYLPILEAIGGTPEYEWEFEFEELRREQGELSRRAMCLINQGPQTSRHIQQQAYPSLPS